MFSNSSLLPALGNAFEHLRSLERLGHLFFHGTGSVSKSCPKNGISFDEFWPPILTPRIHQNLSPLSNYPCLMTARMSTMIDYDLTIH